MSAHGTDNHGHNETLNFYQYFINGYGGFDYASIYGIDATYWENIETEWCDNGYINVTDASKGATGCAYVFKHGLMESAYLKETFTLKSMIAASAWDTNAVWDIKSYTYANGALSLKASDTMTISQTATKIDFAKLGNSGDFKNISAVFFELQSYGSGGNTCSYGSPTYGYQLAIDHVKVHWNGKIPTGGGHHKTFLPPGFASHQHHHVTPLFAAHVTHSGAHADAGAATHAATHHSDGGYHSQLLSLDAQHADGLTDRFHLLQLDHFGT